MLYISKFIDPNSVLKFVIKRVDVLCENKGVRNKADILLNVVLK